MRDMQAKILNELDDRITNAGYEAVQQQQWANTGQLHAQDGFRSVMVIRYQFNSDYCTMSFNGPVVNDMVHNGDLVDTPGKFRRDVCYTVPTFTWHLVKYGTDEVVEMLDFADALLAYAGHLSAIS